MGLIGFMGFAGVGCLGGLLADGDGDGDLDLSSSLEKIKEIIRHYVLCFITLLLDVVTSCYITLIN